jgi:integrase
MTALLEPGHAAQVPKPRRRDRGDDGISWDKTHSYYLGTISLGYDVTGKRVRRTVSGRTKTEVKDKLDNLRDEIKAGLRTPKNYTVEQCVRDWLDSLTLDPCTIASYRGQAEKWIYPKIGRAKLKDLTGTDLEAFFSKLAPHLTKRSMVMVKSTLRRSIRRAQRHDLIGRNVAELIDLPDGRPGHPSRARTQEQAGLVLATARAIEAGYTLLVKVGNCPAAATHAASPAGKLACGTRPHRKAAIQHLGDDLAAATCRSCRAQLGLDSTAPPAARLEALFVVAITVGLRPGELRALTWDHLDLANGAIHVWKSARRGGDTKTPSSRRTLRLPRRAITALQAHKKIQAAERLAAGQSWHDNNLVFCHPDGRPYSRDGLNYRFARITRHAGIGHWHAHEGRHTAVSIMSSNGVPIQDIADTVGHKSTHVTETVYRHVIVPAIRGGAAVMDDIFGTEAAPEVSAG